MKKKISILTATRAEYSLLKPIIRKMNLIEEFDVRVVVTGEHLSPEFGLGYTEILKDGIDIDEKIEFLLSADTSSAVSKSMGLAIIGFADYFKNLKPDILILLGDRYETLAVAITAMNQRIPIAHLYGGETTEGSIDESIRHAITKISYLHFTSTKTYQKRVIQLGEDPKRVFNVGAMGVENIKNEKLITKSKLQKSLRLIPDVPYAMVTFQPVTLENKTSASQAEELLKSIDLNREYQYIFTKGNSDTGGKIINKMIDEYVSAHKNCRVFTSLGTIRYLSAVKYSKMVIGNSSSGIIEVPSFKIPTINIGDRQKGRIQASSVINCEPKCNDIHAAIKKIQSTDFQKRLIYTKNPYEKADTSLNIVNKISEFLMKNKLNIKKKFYDI
jgi:GDP/UDP-N,N'-diacetylbacillosamine 2-epimerase (hydrolysing)